MAGTRDFVRSADIQSFRVADTITIDHGDFIVIDPASGDAEQLADTAGHRVVGRVIGFDPPDSAVDGAITGDTAADYAPEVIVAMGPHILEEVSVATAASQADVGDPVYMTGPRTFTKVATANIPAVGSIVRHISGTTCDVLVRSAWELMQG